MAANFDRIKDLRVLVVGDMIVDHYRNLTPKKISPEAPVIIYEPKSEDWLPGGAGNVASNLLAMGVASVSLASVAGAEWSLVNPYAKPAGARPIEMIIEEPGRKTTIKERLVTDRQQLARIDIQSGFDISKHSEDALLCTILESIPLQDVVVLSDYDHGVMTPGLVSCIVSKCVKYGTPIIVDSKSKNLDKYKGATIALPNNVEAAVMTGMAKAERLKIAERVLERMELDAIGMTLGPDGIMLLRRDGTNRIFPPLDSSDKVVDVTGAGDTVTAAVAIAIGAGMTYDEAMVFANVAAGVVVQKRGVATATMEEIHAAAEAHGVKI